jgi:hypothetical protein
MANRIAIRRGTETAVVATTPVTGELIYTTDEKLLYIGDGTTAGGVSVGVWVSQTRRGDIEFLRGNVLIASTTTTPSEKLHVVGNLRVVGQAFTSLFSNAPSGTSQTINWNNSNSQVLDLSGASGNVTLTFTNPKSGASYVLKVQQGATTRTVVWPGTVLWLGNEPTLSTTANGFNVISFLYDGTNFLGTGDQYWCLPLDEIL